MWSKKVIEKSVRNFKFQVSSLKVRGGGERGAAKNKKVILITFATWSAEKEEKVIQITFLVWRKEQKSDSNHFCDVVSREEKKVIEKSDRKK